MRQLSLIQIDAVEVIEDGFSSFISERIPKLAARKKKSRFDGTPFEALIQGSAKEHGVIGEKIVDELSAALCFHVSRNAGHGDRKINGIKTEIKFARENESGAFIFNQIRPKQDYQVICFVVIRPYSCHIFTAPKETIVPLCHGQHGGKEATETLMYQPKSYDQLHRDLGEYEGIDKFARSFIDLGKEG